MNTPSWIARSVSRLRSGAPGASKTDDKSSLRQSSKGSDATQSIAKSDSSAAATMLVRATRDRLKATLRQRGEALSPRMMRRAYDELRAIIDPEVSEVEGGRRAKEMSAWYLGASAERRRDLWLLMSEMFVSDPEKTRLAQAQYAAALGTPDEAVAEVNYRRATVSPRRRLLQRFSVYPEGIPFLVSLRAEMQSALKTDKRLAALDVEMEYMFSTWFDVGFLDLRRLTWDSPASLVEKLIKYEAVHDIKSWDDVKNRLDSDRRCYGFFHPRLPEEPLIFVEVALLDEMADCVTPLLDETAAAADLNRASTAIFYSISNTQPGLRGVSFGDSLIKRVVELLKLEFPKLKTFATLSPIPGYRAWLNKNLPSLLDSLSEKELSELGRAVGFEPPTAAHVMSAIDKPLNLATSSPARALLMRGAARYLGRELSAGKPTDPVARFHLGNGARVERLNWAGDPSAKGVKQSYGMMVNYLYDLKRIDKNHAMLAQGKVPTSAAIEALFN